MKANVGNVDRFVRMILGVFLIVAWLAGWTTGTWAVVLGIVGLGLALTSLMGTCPVYYMLGFNTKSSTT